MEYDYFLELISDFMPWNIYYYDAFREFIANKTLVTLDEYADHLVMTLPSPRVSWYSKNSYETMQLEITKYANQFIENMGFYSTTASMPILKDMESYNMAIIMFNLIF
jgi:hypothetical protein